MVSSSVLPVMRRASIAKSPSSSSGINSPPSCNETRKDTINKKTEAKITLMGCAINL